MHTSFYGDFFFPEGGDFLTHFFLHFSFHKVLHFEPCFLQLSSNTACVFPFLILSSYHLNLQLSWETFWLTFLFSFSSFLLLSFSFFFLHNVCTSLHGDFFFPEGGDFLTHFFLLFLFMKFPISTAFWIILLFNTTLAFHFLNFSSEIWLMLLDFTPFLHTSYPGGGQKWRTM